MAVTITHADGVGKSTREMSTVAFPYNDLDDSIAVARALLGAGGVPLDRDQMAAAMGISPIGGNFALKLSAARMFGLIAVAQGKVELTDLGFEILDANRERAARAQAFLNVDLYRKLYDTFKGRTLPPRPAGLEQAMVQLGVAQKQRDKARQAFDRSARTAGFFPNASEDRLVAPVIGASAAGPPEPAATADLAAVTIAEAAGAVRPFTPLAGVPPFMTWLVDALPAQGEEWDKASQADWLQAVAQAFRVVFKSDAKETIVVSVRKAGESGV